MNDSWFETPEIGRLAGCLGRLLPHLRRDGVAITGGVAMEIGLARAGHPGSRRTIADLDLVAADLDVVSPGVASPFLISHYHVPQPDAPKFLVQLVDPIARIRIDIFPDLAGAIANAQIVTIGEHAVKVLTLESIFGHKVQTISKASATRPVDPKHDRDARRLGAIASSEVPPVAPGALTADVYRTDADVSCRRCEQSRTKNFPLAPKQKILEILGWS
jgi:hypothetical protein